MKKYAARIVIALLSFFLSFELTARITDVDMRLIKPLLYWQGADKEVHRVSSDPELLYELKPDSSLAWGQRLVTINDLGFRDRKRTKKKEKGVFRIVCFGGSNTYGALVNDNETYTLYLEELLNRKAKGKYEVLNAGCSAYVASQNVQTAKRMLKEYEPDLLIFQLTNRGRRAFLIGSDYAQFFRTNPSLYWENLRFVPAVTSAAGRRIFVHSYAYRTIVLLINHFEPTPAPNPLFHDDRFNEERLAAFYRETDPRVPIAVWDWGGRENIVCCGVPMTTLFVFDPASYPPHAGKEYFEIHPPCHVYRWYAEALFRELEKKRLIKV